MGREAPSDFVRLSARIGKNRLLVQGGGGNTSIKVGEWLWIKASGTWLSRANDEPIFVRIPCETIRRRVQDGTGEDLSDLIDQERLRPSIETAMHAVFPQAVVVHVHSVNAIALGVQKNGRDQVEKRLQGLPWVWVPYAKPGLSLCSALQRGLANSRSNAKIAVLVNHGLVVAGETCHEVENLLADVEQRLSCDVRPLPPYGIVALTGLNDVGWAVSQEREHHAIGADAITFQIARLGALYPDHVVFLGRTLPEILPGEKASDAIRRITEEKGREPSYLVHEGAGILMSPALTSGAKAMLKAISLVGSRLHSPGGIQYLPEREIDKLLNWNAEKFRRTLDQ